MGESLLATLSSMYGIPSVDTAVCPMPTNNRHKKKMPKTIERICECTACSINVFSSHSADRAGRKEKKNRK